MSVLVINYVMESLVHNSVASACYNCALDVETRLLIVCSLAQPKSIFYRKTKCILQCIDLYLLQTSLQTSQMSLHHLAPSVHTYTNEIADQPVVHVTSNSVLSL